MSQPKTAEAARAPQGRLEVEPLEMSEADEATAERVLLSGFLGGLRDAEEEAVEGKLTGASALGRAG